MQKNPLDIWRLAADLSVVNAAILIVGGDPSSTDLVDSDSYSNEAPYFEKRTVGHQGFQGAFSALRTAIQNKQLQAQLRYRARPYYRQSYDADAEFWIVTSGSLSAKFSDDFTSEYKDLITSEAVTIEKIPDWDETTISVAELKVWLASRGVTDGFFFPKCSPDQASFLRPGPINLLERGLAA